MLRYRRALPTWDREMSQSSRFMPSGYDDLDVSVHEDESESRRVFLSVMAIRLGSVLGKRAGAAAMLSICTM